MTAEVLGRLRPVLAGIDALPGCKVGLCAEGLEGPLTGRRFGVAADDALPSASIIKVFVLAELLRRADSGDVSLEDKVLVREEDMVEDSPLLEADRILAETTLGRLAEGMISASDNTATNLLISLLGKDSVNALVRDLSMRRTALRREMMNSEARARGEENLTSASDTVALLAAIWRGTFLSAASRRLALDLLERQRVDSKLPITLPPGAGFLHKTGDLENVENDAGLVVHPRGTFALAILTFGDPKIAAPRVGDAVRVLCEAFLNGGGER